MNYKKNKKINFVNTNNKQNTSKFYEIYYYYIKTRHNGYNTKFQLTKNLKIINCNYDFEIMQSLESQN